MKKTRNKYIEDLRYLSLLIVAALGLITIVASGGGGGDVDNKGEIASLDDSTYFVSGKILSNDTGIEGISVKLFGDMEYTTETDENGIFLFEDIPGGNYSVYCESEEYNFSPENINFNISDHNITDISIGATEVPTYFVSGKILSNDTGIEGISVKLFGDMEYITETDENGIFLFEDVPGGNYSVYCESEKYNFSPENINFDISDHNITDISIGATEVPTYFVSGKILSNDTGIEGISVKLFGDMEYITETDENGIFLFEDIPGGNYSVYCESEKYNFFPENINFDISDHNITDISIKAIDFINIYNVDFSSPVHTVGSRPAIHSVKYPRETPTFITSGNPHVVESFYSLNDQPCVFGGYVMDWPDYDQLEFEIEQNYNIYSRFVKYRFEMDLLIFKFAGASSNEAFTILFDMPNVQKIVFHPDGTITYGEYDIVGTFEFGNQMHVQIDIDIDSKIFRLFVDGQEIIEDSIGAFHFSSVRLSMHSSSVDSILGVDNIRIYDISNKSNIEYFIFDGEQYSAINFPASDSTICSGFNDYGDVVGHYWRDGKKYNFTFSSTLGYRALNLNDELNPELVDISNENIIVGEYDTYYPSAFIIDEQSSIETTTFDDFSSTFTGGFSSLGEIVYSNRSNRFRTGSQLDFVETTLGLHTSHNAVYGINSSSFIVGNQVAFVGFLVDDDGFQFNSYVYDGYNFNTIEYPNADVTYLSGINDNNVVSGFFRDEQGKYSIFTYDYSSKSFHLIEELNVNNSFSVDINNSGHILGAQILPVLYPND